MNIYHEFGHMLDNAPGLVDVFSGALDDPSFVGDNGYLTKDSRNSVDITNDPNYASVQSIQASRNTPTEQWADAFANYVAGNINLDTSSGKDMYNFVTKMLIQNIPIDTR